jgi:hypothetical protein
MENVGERGFGSFCGENFLLPKPSKAVFSAFHDV